MVEIASEHQKDLNTQLETALQVGDNITARKLISQGAKLDPDHVAHNTYHLMQLELQEDRRIEAQQEQAEMQELNKDFAELAEIRMAARKKSFDKIISKLNKTKKSLTTQKESAYIPTQADKKLFSAIKSGDTQGIYDAMTQGASLKATDENGFNPITLAVQSNKMGTLEMIITNPKYKNELDFIDKNGNTAYSLAKKMNNDKAMTVLEKNGASTKQVKSVGTIYKQTQEIATDVTQKHTEKSKRMTDFLKNNATSITNPSPSTNNTIKQNAQSTNNAPQPITPQVEHV